MDKETLISYAEQKVAAMSETDRSQYFIFAKAVEIKRPNGRTELDWTLVNTTVGQITKSFLSGTMFCKVHGIFMPKDKQDKYLPIADLVNIIESDENASRFKIVNSTLRADESADGPTKRRAGRPPKQD